MTVTETKPTTKPKAAKGGTFNLVSCSINDLTAAIGRARRALPASGKYVLPILGQYLIRVEDGDLTISATNLDTAVKAVVPAEATALISDSFGVCVSADLFGAWVSGLTGNEPAQFGLESGTKKLVTTCGRSTAKFATMPTEDFPLALDQPASGLTFTILPATLRRLISHTVKATSNEAHHHLSGIHITVAGETIRMEAADGFRLHVDAAPLAEPVTATVSFLIPGPAMNDLAAQGRA